MGNETSAPSDYLSSSAATALSHSNPRSNEISNLIQFAHDNFEENPTDALSALMQAMTLNSGQAKANEAMYRIRAELGSEVAENTMDRTGRMQRAARIVQELLHDESTLLYERGQQHILQQAMEDGSSLVCTKCNGMIPVSRWKQHQSFWCESIEKSTLNDSDGDDDVMMLM